MAEEKKHKSPEELGEAVGRKIDALFGNIFGEESPAEEPPVESSHASTAAKPEPEPVYAPTESPPEPEPIYAPSDSAPPPSVTPPQPSQPPKRPVAKEERRPPAAPAKDDAKGKPLSESLDRIEALVLSLEWEMNPETVRELLPRFREMERFFPEEGHARTILNMNRRVLKRFASPDVAPHPRLVRLLQDSIAAMKQLHASGGKPPGDGLLTRISESYKEIMAATEAGVTKPPAPAPQKEVQNYSSVVSGLGGTVHSLEELSQRLGRILAVLRQGGEMSREEIARRLGTLESLLSERVGQLASLHGQLTLIKSPQGGAEASAESPAEEKVGADGLLMVVCEGSNVAVPSSLVTALYPLPKQKGQSLAGKNAINLGNRLIRRFPLSGSKTAQQKESPIPSWLIHLSVGKRDFFLLAERALGYRRSPKGADLGKQTRIKIGGTPFLVVGKAALR